MPVAPKPPLTGLHAANDPVLGCVEVGCRVTVLRVIAAGDVSTFQAHSQVHPCIAERNAFGTLPCLWFRYGYDLHQIGTDRRHQSVT